VLSESFRTKILHAVHQKISLVRVKKGILALIALVLALHAGLGCGIAQARVASIEAPCCGANCPVPSSVGDRACCQVQNSDAAAEAISGSPSTPSLQPLVGSIHPSLVMPATGFKQASIFVGSPPGVVKLALLCSRQI